MGLKAHRWTIKISFVIPVLNSTRWAEALIFQVKTVITPFHGCIWLQKYENQFSTKNICQNIFGRFNWFSSLVVLCGCAVIYYELLVATHKGLFTHATTSNDIQHKTHSPMHYSTTSDPRIWAKWSGLNVFVLVRLSVSESCWEINMFNSTPKFTTPNLIISKHIYYLEKGTDGHHWELTSKTARRISK